jgi:2TM domain-containing protein
VSERDNSAVTSRDVRRVDDDLLPVRPHRAADLLMRAHAATYVLVNLFLIGVWAATGAGYFWPIWPIMGWGLAVAIQGMATYGLRRPN